MLIDVAVKTMMTIIIMICLTTDHTEDIEKSSRRSWALQITAIDTDGLLRGGFHSWTTHCGTFGTCDDNEEKERKHFGVSRQNRGEIFHKM